MEVLFPATPNIKEFDHTAEPDPDPKDPSVYDLNHDGHINVADVNKFANYILRHPDEEAK